MKNSNYLLGCVSLFVVLVNSVVLAGNIPGAVTVTVADAYYHFDGKRHLDNSALPNIAIAYNFTNHWAMEAGAGVLNSNQKSALGNEGVHGMLYTIDGIYRFIPFKQVEPYIIGGVGVLVLNPNGDDAEHPGVINAGMGAQLFWGSNVALRGEVRDIYQTTGASNNDYMINFGVSFLFGENEKSQKKDASYKS